MTDYYFLASALPPLQIGMPPEISFQEFQNLLKDNLTAKDFEKAYVLRLYYDIQNIRAFWKGEILDPWGNLDEMELEEALLAKESLPDYLQDFLERHTSLESRLHDFAALPTAYFAKESSQASGFAREYLKFERELRLILTAFRAKQLNRDLIYELQFEDPDDDFVAQILAQKDAKSYIPPEEYQEIKTLLETYSNDPLSLHQALCEFRYQKIEEMLGVDLFSINRVLGYMIQLILVEKWQALDKQKGLEVANAVFQLK